jgi:hypothetical protein
MDPSYLLSSVNCLRMNAQLRQAVGSALQIARNSVKESLLYAILMVGNKLVTVLRPKKQSLHPTGRQFQMLLS